MTEEEFRSDQASRSELEAILNSKTFLTAVDIYKNKRRVIEAVVESNLSADPICSVRINSQRIGAEGLLAEFEIYSRPMPIPPTEDEATYGQDEAVKKLKELGITL